MATRLDGGPLSAEYHNTTNFPALIPVNNRPVLAFDATTDEEISWTSVAPQGLTGTITVIVYYMMASATSGSVRWQAQIEAITPGDATDLDATTSFDSLNSAGGTVPATAGYEQAITITMTNADSIAAGDTYRLALRRDADGTSGTDDATGDAYLIRVELRDAAV